VIGWRLPHTVARRGPLELAFPDGSWRVAAPGLETRGLVCAPVGTLERGALRVGDCVEFQAT
jgi:hypothetical protein